jgi:hypothetical protein
MAAVALVCGRCGQGYSAMAKSALCPMCANAATPNPFAQGAPDFSYLRELSDDSACALTSGPTVDEECAMSTISPQRAVAKHSTKEMPKFEPAIAPSPLGVPLIVSIPTPFAATAPETPPVTGSRWKDLLLIGLGLYAAVATTLAVWGWLRPTGSTAAPAQPAPAKQKT